MTLLQELQNAIEASAERTGPAVVGLGRGWGVGSGTVIAPGQVLTNAHNLRHNHGEVDVSFHDGRRQTGRVVGVDADLDIAVISVETGDAEPVRWPEDRAEPTIGLAVLALGNPGGRGLRVTPGFISSTARSFRGPRGRRVTGAIEHTAPLPRGSSGGPLVDPDGVLLGINSIRVEGGLILAIPTGGTMRERVDALSRGETPKRARLGVAIAPPRVARRLRRAVGLPERDGVLVRAVEDGSPAAAAGIERGDLIVAVADREMTRVDILYEALDAVRGEGQIELTVVRGTEERTITVTL
jgi:serine protease Do